MASTLSGCKPTFHIPVEQEHVGETPGFIWEVVAILVVRITYQAKRALNLCRRYWEIYQKLGQLLRKHQFANPKMRQGHRGLQWQLPLCDSTSATHP